MVVGLKRPPTGARCGRGLGCTFLFALQRVLWSGGGRGVQAIVHATDRAHSCPTWRSASSGLLQGAMQAGRPRPACEPRWLIVQPSRNRPQPSPVAATQGCHPRLPPSAFAHGRVPLRQRMSAGAAGPVRGISRHGIPRHDIPHHCPEALHLEALHPEALHPPSLHLRITASRSTACPATASWEGTPHPATSRRRPIARMVMSSDCGALPAKPRTSRRILWQTVAAPSPADSTRPRRWRP